MSHLDETRLLDLATALGSSVDPTIDHLASCPSCRGRIRSFSSLQGALREEVDIDDRALDRLASEVLASTPIATPGPDWAETVDRWWDRALTPLLSAACVIVASILVGFDTLPSPLAILSSSLVVGGAMAVRGGRTSGKQATAE